MLLAVAASGHLTRLLPLKLPLPIAQILLGAMIAWSSSHSVSLQPDLFFLLFLPPLLFLDGWRIPKSDLFRDKWGILALAFGLVIFTVLGLGYLIHALIPALPLPIAFALAAVLSPTDPVAVSSITQGIPIPKRVMRILEGESLLNDASGLVCFRFAVAAALSGTFSALDAGLSLLWVTVLGIGMGAGVTWLISATQRYLSRHFGEVNGSPILINLITPFGAYLAAEHVGGSGILAAVSAGITMSYVELSGRALATTRVQRAAVWETIQFTLNGIMFVLLGEQLPAIFRRAASTVETAGHLSSWWLLVYALAILLALIVLRYLWVWFTWRCGLILGKRLCRTVPALRHRLVAVMSLAGVRGAVTLAGVLTLPIEAAEGIPLPGRDLAIFLSASTILLSLLVANFGLPYLLRSLALPEETQENREIDFARFEAAQKAIAAIEEARRSISENNAEISELYTNAAVRVIANYKPRIESQGVMGSVAAEKLREADQAEIALRLAALRAERETIFHLARLGNISDETSRKLVRQIDLQEARYR